jgi:CubicO group peptidase (beta-lactamase class C family)
MVDPSLLRVPGLKKIGHSVPRYRSRGAAAFLFVRAMCPLGTVILGCVSPAAMDGRAAVTIGASAPDASETAPRFSQGGPDAQEYGASQGYPIGDRTTCSQPAFRVGCHSHFDQVYEGRLVRRATSPSPLARAAQEPAVRYEVQAQTFTIDDYLARNPTTGLLVARGDTILLERYQYARHDRHRFMSWSMAKTVTAMLIGIAIAEGRIRSVNDAAAVYVPALIDTEYGRTSLRHLLQMSQACASSRNTREVTTRRNCQRRLTAK